MCICRPVKPRDGINNPAEIGTLMMEFGKLSKLTGINNITMLQKGMMFLYTNGSVLDLVGEQIDVQTGKWVNSRSQIGAYIDSYYEYLYKSWLLFGDADFKVAFDTHNKAIKKHLIHKTPKGWFMHQVDMNTGKITGTTYGALEAFYAGLCALPAMWKQAGRYRKPVYMWTRFNMEPEDLIL
ncbi:MAG: glycoside hydrolase family 47 protein [Chitinophagaceae bacterium]|nr:glycoside hydrolase family 47 protein [Chitinophagaceae bacterium]